MRLDKQQQGDDNESGWTGGKHKERHCPLCTTLSEDFLFCAEEILQATVDNFVQAATGRLEKCDAFCDIKSWAGSRSEVLSPTLIQG